MSVPRSAAARSLILGRIRDTLGERSAPCDVAYQRIPRGYRDGVTLTSDACLDLLEERLGHYQVAVHRCGASRLPHIVGEILKARGAERMIVPADIDRGWLPAGVEFTPDHGLTYSDLDRCGGFLTACSLAIARFEQKARKSPAGSPTWATISFTAASRGGRRCHAYDVHSLG